METKAKKRLLNGIMVVLILVIAASGIVTVGKLRGWFEDTKESAFVSGEIKGNVNIERKGIGYSLESDIPLQDEDIIETKKGAQAEVFWETEKYMILNGNTEVGMKSCADEAAVVEVNDGEIFADVSADTKQFHVEFGGTDADLSGAIFSVSVQSGSSTLYLYAGDVRVVLEDDTKERVEAGEYLSVVSDVDGKYSYEIAEIQINSLSEFQITQMQSSSNPEKLCFHPEELQSVLDARAEEKQKALEASLKTQTVVDVDKADTAKENEEENTVSNDVEESVSENSTEEDGETVSEENMQNTNICTITILCDTILDNMDNLDAGKEAYVPANGTILATSSVEFEDGETVFDVLNRVCEYAGIQIEYSWTAIYNSYYIEGINNLYEFDCGNESGWMYKVNGWFPNYGCSSYELEDGDNIVWCYTCNGLGADVGGAAY